MPRKKGKNNKNKQVIEVVSNDLSNTSGELVRYGATCPVSLSDRELLLRNHALLQRITTDVEDIKKIIARDGSKAKKV